MTEARERMVCDKCGSTRLQRRVTMGFWHCLNCGEDTTKPKKAIVVNGHRYPDLVKRGK